MKAIAGHVKWCHIFRVKTAVLIATLLCFNTSRAVEGSDLNEAEWNSWPDYCKAGYLASEWSSGSHFKNRVSSGWVSEFRKTHNERIGIPGVHHFCVGMVYINRAKTAGKGRKYDYLVDHAISEIDYSYSRLNKSAPYFSVVAAYRGTAFILKGQRNKAIEAWNEGIEVQPNRRESYLAMAQAFIGEKKHKDALEVLLKFDAAKEKETPDAEYFLGYVYFELGRYEEARRHVDRAHQLGYPYMGLKNKLDRLGK